VWPYGLIGDEGLLHDIGVRTFLSRPNKNEDDWSADPVQAARLGLADEFKSSALSLTERYQTFPSGLASFMGSEFYVEQIGVLADAIQAALVQDYDGLIRVAPAWPKDWNADGTVFIQHRGKVHVQIHDGEIVTVGIDSGAASPIKVRNPWPGESVEVVNARTFAVVVPTSQAKVLQFLSQASTNYLIRPSGGENSLSFMPISGVRAIAPASLGSRMIGIAK
jgi:alpha-L-fucosidase 2